MTHGLGVRASAWSDMRAARDWYEAERIGLGRQFLDAVERTFELIALQPLAYASISRGVRRAPLKRFPYQVIYQITADRVEVVAVVHSHRRPGSWRDRLSP